MSQPFAALEAQVKPKYWEGYSLAEDEERAEELFLGRVVKNNETGRSSDEYPIRDSSREREALAAVLDDLGNVAPCSRSRRTF